MRTWNDEEKKIHILVFDWAHSKRLFTFPLKTLIMVLKLTDLDCDFLTTNTYTHTHRMECEWKVRFALSAAEPFSDEIILMRSITLSFISTSVICD